MRILIFSLLFVLLGCASKKDICDENPAFKEQFFQSIRNAEDVIYGKFHNREKYDEGLRFLSQYVSVDYDKALNYRNVYTLRGFEDDKKKWLKWYEENKCQNIQFK